MDVIVQIWWTRPADYRAENAHLTPRRGDVIEVYRDPPGGLVISPKLIPKFAFIRVMNCPLRGQGPATNFMRIQRAIKGDQHPERRTGCRVLVGNLRNSKFSELRDTGQTQLQWRHDNDPNETRSFQPILRRLTVVNPLLPDLDDTSDPVTDDDI